MTAHCCLIGDGDDAVDGDDAGDVSDGDGYDVARSMINEIN